MIYLVSTERQFTPVATHSHHIPDYMYGGYIFGYIYSIYWEYEQQPQAKIQRYGGQQPVRILVLEAIGIDLE